MDVIACCILAFSLMVAPDAIAREAVQRALVPVSVNDVPRGDALVLIEGTQIWVSAETLRRLELTPPEELRTVAGASYAALAAFAPDVSYAFDDVSLELKLRVAPQLLGRSRVKLPPQQPANLVHRSNPAGFVNYAVTWDAARSPGIAADAGVSIGSASLSTTISTSPQHGLQRGHTTLVLDDRSRLTRWSFGDRFGQSGALGGAALLGGVSFTREFSINPYFVRHPTAGLSGAVSTPSTVDVYVNEQLVARQNVPAGEFELGGVVLPHGAGSTRYVVRDAFGKEQHYSSDFYAPQSTLAQGLHEFDYQVGARRTRGGTYGPLAALGRHRVGVSDALTAGFRFEVDRRLVNAGATVSARVAKGELGAAAAASTRDGLRGGSALLTYAYSARSISAAAGLSATTDGYRTFSDGMAGAERSSSPLEGSASASFRLGPRLSIAIRERVGRDPRGTWRLDEISAATTVHRMLSVWVAARHGGPVRGGSVIVSASVPMGRMRSATFSTDAGRGGYGPRVELQQSLPSGPGTGYRLYSQGSIAGATAQHNTSFGRYEARQEVVDGRPSTVISAAGSVVAIGGGVHVARPVEGAFALVRVPDAPGVRVFLNHQVAGRTDRHGNLLVSDLLPYYGNRLRVAEEDMDVHRSAETGEQTLSAPPRGGAVVDFEGEEIRPFTGTIRIVDGSQTLTPAYGDIMLTLGGEEVTSPLGRNGQFYFENLPAGRYMARVVKGTVSCALEIVVPAAVVTSAREWRCAAARAADATAQPLTPARREYADRAAAAPHADVPVEEPIRGIRRDRTAVAFSATLARLRVDGALLGAAPVPAGDCVRQGDALLPDHPLAPCSGGCGRQAPHPALSAPVEVRSTSGLHRALFMPEGPRRDRATLCPSEGKEKK